MVYRDEYLNWLIIHGPYYGIYYPDDTVFIKRFSNKARCWSHTLSVLSDHILQLEHLGLISLYRTMLSTPSKCLQVILLSSCSIMSGYNPEHPHRTMDYRTPDIRWRSIHIH